MTVAVAAHQNSRAACPSIRSIAIVGGGASGVLMAAHLLREHNTGLNVRASNMSAFADKPDDFVDWLREHRILAEDPATYFAPRRLYGEYLEQRLDQLRNETRSRLHVIDEECIGLRQHDSFLELLLTNGSSLVVQRCVLATGHEHGSGCCATPSAAIGSGKAPSKPTDRVLIIGTGLSMVDKCLLLLLRGHTGEIVAVSRRGLLPAVHRRNRPITIEDHDVPLGRSPTHLTAWFRRLVTTHEASGGDWRDVVDGLRPHNQQIWQHWSIAQRRQFFRHLKAWWDIHRHRMAPQVSERLAQAIATGQLGIVAGRVHDIAPAGGGFLVKLQHRRGQKTHELQVDRICDCAGVIADPDRSANPLIRSLLDTGAVRTDPLRIGLDVATDCALIDGKGKRQALLYAVGPLSRGTFLEIEAIPDIRVQCQRLAEALHAGPGDYLPRE